METGYRNIRARYVRDIRAIHYTIDREQMTDPNEANLDSIADHSLPFCTVCRAPRRAGGESSRPSYLF